MGARSAGTEQIQDLAGIGVSTERLLGEDARAVDVDLEHAASGRDDLQGGDVLFELVQDLGRQTDGTFAVASNGAVFDADLHHVLPPRTWSKAMLTVPMGSRSQVIDPPRSTHDGGGGGGGGWAWLVTARGIIEAQLIRGLLEEAGVVPVWLDTRDPSPGAWMFMSGNPNAPVAIYVPISHLDGARLALLESGLADGPSDGGDDWSPEERERLVRWSPWGIVGVALAAFVIVILLLASMHGSVTS